MNYNEYMEEVKKSEIGSLTKYPKIVHALLGMNGEAGECIDMVKKTLFQGHDFDINHFLLELGDVCWYSMLYISESIPDPDILYDNFNLTRRNTCSDILGNECCLSYVLNINSACSNLINAYYNGNGMLQMELLIVVFENISKAAERYGKTLKDICEMNVEKIKKRYPDGFSCEKSKNRSDSM